MMEISKKTILISIITLLMFSAVVNISAESIWEGSAAMGRYGEFPFTGFYGASNSFQQNDFVEVENLENGKRTRLIVVDRLSDSGLLMLVSNEAAQELGIFQNDIARIKVRKLSSGQSPAAIEYDDLAYSPDPDLNPAAALIGPDERLVVEPETIAVEPEAVETEVVEAEVVEAEVVETEVVETVQEPDVVVIPDPVIEPETEISDSRETEPPVLIETTPSSDGLNEAEILVTEEEIPADIASDSPEKPFDWPDTIGIKETEPEPEPLYLTMEELEEGRPLEDSGITEEIAHSAETQVLWPDDGIPADTALAEAPEEAELIDNRLEGASPLSDDPGTTGSGMEIPESSLELLSSGLDETNPVFHDTENFSISIVPELIEKESGEELTDTSDYYAPAEQAAAVALTGLHAPEPEIPVEVIAVLVGDYALADSMPETVGVDTSYIDSPELAESDEAENELVGNNLAEAQPLQADEIKMIASALPMLPTTDESTLVDVANGYRSPEPAEFTGLIADYPDPNAGVEAGEETVLVEAANGYVSPETPGFEGEVTDYPNPEDASVPVDVPNTGEELAHTEAPAGDDGSELPEMTEVPELVEATETDEADAELDTTVPEYDENLEVSLVPAEVRPPELIEEETALGESEPDETETLETDIAEHIPETDISEPETVAVIETVVAEPEPIVVVETVVTEPEPEPEPALELTLPEEVIMVSKLVQTKHYLQLGAFKEKNSAIKAAGSLANVYPVTIFTDDASAGISYKLLLGPLSADESGIMLYNFRAGGYSDAFIRRID